ncbi:hypothetical protein RGF97_15430 [Streptomyces roseicoloratus]|uniref:CsbD-like domain-containing protein n=1 Tax=Streptomyces roseicoloratus TaxID=2508722 RepID=A0ABY9RXM6_9ACTN|nr:hypothetical protein [Streptomyces roseicoloratus]WMX45959.1 hypothetical protein RGF97_15430 [Streptomyces roseicoloratus]
MAWDEWEQIKAQVVADHDTRMELNSTKGEAASADLKTHAQGKQGAIEALANTLTRTTACSRTR